MCHCIYRHYPKCGHIASFQVSSCPAFMAQLRHLLSASGSVSCREMEITHGLTQQQNGPCAQCELDLARNGREVFSPTHIQPIEGLYADQPVIQLSARIAGGQVNRGSSSSSLSHVRVEEERQSYTGNHECICPHCTRTTSSLESTSQAETSGTQEISTCSVTHDTIDNSEGETWLWEAEIPNASSPILAAHTADGWVHELAVTSIPMTSRVSSRLLHRHQARDQINTTSNTDSLSHSFPSSSGNLSTTAPLRTHLNPVRSGTPFVHRNAISFQESHPRHFLAAVSEEDARQRGLKFPLRIGSLYTSLA